MCVGDQNCTSFVVSVLFHKTGEGEGDAYSRGGANSKIYAPHPFHSFVPLGVHNLKEVPPCTVVPWKKRWRDGHNELRVRDPSQVYRPKILSLRSLIVKKICSKSEYFLRRQVEQDETNMAPFGTFLWTQSKVNHFTLCSNTRLHACLICISSS